MSERNADCVRRFIEAYNARDFETVEALLHPDLVWYPEDEQPEPGPFRGRDGYIQYAREWIETFDGYEVEPIELVEIGDCVAFHGRVHGSGRVSGVAVDSDAAAVWRLRDGVAVEHRECRTMEQALGLAHLPSFQPPAAAS